jgi:hypothetical protein
MAKILRTNGIEPGEIFFSIGKLVGSLGIIAGGLIHSSQRSSIQTTSDFSWFLFLGAGTITLLLFYMGSILRPWDNTMEEQVEKLIAGLPSSYFAIKDFTMTFTKLEEGLCIDYLVVGPNGIFPIKLLDSCKVVKLPRNRKVERKKPEDLCSAIHECLCWKRALQDFVIKYKKSILPRAPKKLETLNIQPLIVMLREGEGMRNLAVPTVNLANFREWFFKEEAYLRPGEALNLRYFLRNQAFYW